MSTDYYHIRKTLFYRKNDSIKSDFIVIYSFFAFIFSKIECKTNKTAF